MEDKKELIERILNSYNSAKKLQDMQDPTFLSVIGKDYHENYLSRLIAYALKKDQGFLRALLRLPETVQLGDPTVECEKYMDGNRADIFIEIPDANITVTIENKINTWEHDDQTQTYYDWVVKKFDKTKYKNYFFYLRPDYNPSEPSCGEYETIAYKKLAEIIPNDTDDRIICDLKKHISKLGVNNMKFEKYDIEVIKHYDELTEALSWVKRHIVNYQNAAIDEIKGKLNYTFLPWKKRDETKDKDNTLLIEIKTDNGIISSYRLYKSDWYERDSYYFYVEILFVYEENYGDIRGIRFQRTLRAPSRDAAKKIKDSDKIPFETSENEYLVLEKSEQINFSDDVWEDPDEKWKKFVVDKATDILPRMLEQQSKDFKDFMEHKS